MQVRLSKDQEGNLWVYKIGNNNNLFIVCEHYFSGVHKRFGLYALIINNNGTHERNYLYSDFQFLSEPYRIITSFCVGLNEINQIGPMCFEIEQKQNRNFKWEIPIWGILTKSYFSLVGGTEDWEYWLISECEDNTNEIEIFGEKLREPEDPLFLPYPEGKARISKKEFYVLMQIYYGVYGENIYYNALKTYEQEGKYAEIQKLYELYGTGKEEQLDWERLREDINNSRYNYNEELLNEYLMIKLLEKDTTGVFEGLEITKIYDERWSDEDKLLNLPEIQALFGENVIIEEE